MKLPTFLRLPILSLTQHFGYQISKLNQRGDIYGPILTNSTYSPWYHDLDFLRIYHEVKNHTLIDIYRLHEIWSIVRQLQSISGDLLEVGVWKGGSGALLASCASLAGFKCYTFLCDTFSGVVKAGPRDESYIGGEHADASISDVQFLIKKLGIPDIHILQGTFPDESATLIDSRRFRFCHIDVDVYQSAKDIVDWVWPRLSPGGVVVFDDYGCQRTNGVTTLVNEYSLLEDRFVIYNLNGHALMIKTAPEGSINTCA